MVELIRGLDAETVRANLARVQERIAGAGRVPGEVEILVRERQVADHWMVEAPDAAAMEEDVVGGPPGSEVTTS